MTNTKDDSLLDRSERLTATGVGAIRIAAGVFFLIPGLYKLVNPADFVAMMQYMPGILQENASFVIGLVTIAEIVGGLLLIVGWNIRLAVLPLVVITVVANALVVTHDYDSKLRLLSVSTHLMGVGLYLALILLGSGRWAVSPRFNILYKLASASDGRFPAIAQWLTSGAAHNRGIQLIRLAVSIPFISAFFLGMADTDYRTALFSNGPVITILLSLSLLGGIAMLAGFQRRATGWLLAGLTLLHLFTVGIPDVALSQIGIINLLFHCLILASVVALRLIEYGSELEVEHILSQDKRNVVVVGGGFAGTQLVKKLENKLSSEWQVVLISEENYTTFNPMLAEVVGASILPSHVIAPIRRMLRRTRFISARVTSIDTNDRKVQFEGEGKNSTIPYEHLVLSIGSRANMELVPGMQEHAMPFKLLGDALELRNRVITQMEIADLETDPELRQWFGHFIIIGAGFSGVEVGGAIQDFIRASQRHYPRLHDSDLKVTVIHRRDIPLQEMKPSLGEHAMAKMKKRGIHFLMSTGVDAVDSEGVITSGGERVDGATVVSTIGTRPNPLIESLQLPTERGRICLNADMSVPGNEGIWAMGDCALVQNAHDNELAPPTAQFAIREGQQLADNIALAISGRATRPFNYAPRGSMATTGHLAGVAEIFGKIRLGGFPAWLVWRAFYLSLMPTFAKKTRIFFEWTWSMLFSPDIINLRFTTSRAADKQRR